MYMMHIHMYALSHSHYIYCPVFLLTDSPAHDVLDRLHSSACTPPVVDVYLGKDRFNTDVEGVPHVILSGWLGSVPYQNGMTYGDLLHSTRQHLPVSPLNMLHVYWNLLNLLNLFTCVPVYLLNLFTCVPAVLCTCVPVTMCTC